MIKILHACDIWSKPSLVVKTGLLFVHLFRHVHSLCGLKQRISKGKCSLLFVSLDDWFTLYARHLSTQYSIVSPLKLFNLSKHSSCTPLK